MKLIQEYLIKICISVFLLSILMELYILFLLMNRSPKMFDKAYNETLSKTENKSIIITKKIDKYISSLLMKYSGDVKLICKHALLLNGKEQNYKPESIMEDNINIFNINNEKKSIVNSTLEEINKNDYMKDFYNETSHMYDYLNSYEKKFKDIYDNNFILTKLFSDEHKELNTISYYNMLNKNKIFSKEEENNIKFLISILKTIFIRRYIVKRNNNDYIRFYLLNEDEILIYPPEAYVNTNLYNFDTNFIKSKCNYFSNNKEERFPLCLYKYIFNEILDKESNYASILTLKINYENIISSVCIKIPFIRGNPNKVILCLEINFSKIFDTANFMNPKKLEFGLFKYSPEIEQIIPLIYNSKKVYNEIKNIFKDFEIEKYRIDDQKNGIFTFFHFLYYNLTQIVKNRSEIKLDYTSIEEEYNITINKIISEIKNYDKNISDKIIINFTKTICRKGLLINTYECIKDEYKMIIYPLLFDIGKLNKDFLETIEHINKSFDLYAYSIIATNPFINTNMIYTILNIKIERSFILFLLLTIAIFCFYIILINLISEYSLNKIDKIISELKNLEIDSNMEEYYTLPEDKIGSPNKELYNIKNIYEVMRTVLIIKQVFENENYLDKHNSEFYNLVQNISKKDIREIGNSYIAFYHFKNKAYNIAEKEFKSTIIYIQESENLLIRDKNSEYEEKIKDEIKRSSTVSYINEYSVFAKIDENMLKIIKIKIFKQRFVYLYAMIKYKLGKGENNNNIGLNNNQSLANKNKSKKDKDKKISYFKDAIKYFTECKNINNLLGINQIKVIYALIMISKCYMNLNDYKNSIISINEALNLYFELSKSFKDNHSKNYNPKVMMFVENNIYQYILFNIERICYMFNKPFACYWIGFKIFETSPFLISNIHSQSATFILNYFEKNKLKIINKLDSKNINNNSNILLSQEYEKIKKYYGKIIPRVNIKNANNKTKFLSNDKIVEDISYSTSYPNKTDSKTEKSNISATPRKDVVTGKSTFLTTKNKNLSKIITLCLSEKILNKVNGLELKDVIIKYFQKYFIMNDKDKFSFVQFSNNGKKTVYINTENLEDFIQNIQKTNNAFEAIDSYITKKSNSNMAFTELFNIFHSIIKNYSSKEDSLTDNIIIMFINSDDIRFTSINECLNIVNELNKKNTSVFILSYDKVINKDKINNIHSFLNGLFEGYFFQIKNFQQIKQIFINISTKKYQSNFFGYDFNSIDNEL